ncbi:MAG: hypothetical protein Q4E00_11115 [Actinomyces bowdenii]|nr:hypothetical protein [Actinomyces bowdenii]
MTDPHHDAQSGHVPGTPVHDQYAATAAYPQGHVGSLGGPFQDGVPLAGSASATEGAGAPIPMGSPVPAAAPAASQQPAAPAVPQAPAASSAPPAGAPGLAQPPGAPGSPWLQGQQAPQAQPSGGVGYPQVGYPGDASAPAVGRPAGHPATGGSPSGHPSGYHQTSPYTSYPGHPQGAGPAQPAYQPSAVSAQQPSAYQAVPASPYQAAPAAPAYQPALQPAPLAAGQAAWGVQAGTEAAPSGLGAQALASPMSTAPSGRRVFTIMGLGALLVVLGMVAFTWSVVYDNSMRAGLSEINTTGAVRAELRAGEEYGLYHKSGARPQCSVTDPDGEAVTISEVDDARVVGRYLFGIFTATSSGPHVISCEGEAEDSSWVSSLVASSDVVILEIILMSGIVLMGVGLVPLVTASAVRWHRRRALMRAYSGGPPPHPSGGWQPGAVQGAAPGPTQGQASWQTGGEFR